MADQPENPQAYPCLDDSGFGSLSMRDPGMTLRDRIAIAALPALITGRDWTHLSDADKPAGWALAAYVVADALLRERGK